MGKLTDLALATANSSFKEEHWISACDVVEAVKTRKIEESKLLQLIDFFTDNSVETIWDFCVNHGIDLWELKEFYEKCIKPYAVNRELEELWKF
ncbi:hypothetical protein [Phorcysia thermohydrogeniphila]|uniref:Uncharacterized protein n=1 Tax=Phorcysia thermohydrogeniphila TaxID=936138 RepID=A0A4R1G905_9BACT|nr:hypothetical protein [Phorcysia thermohydrogeniphila]TCK04627.1 hypothetical protein CLV27_1060 [Phorcysia thermohydrogeniphila]